MRNHQEVLSKELNEMEGQLKQLAKMMIHFLLTMKQQGKIDEAEYNRLVEKKLDFLG